MRARCITKKQLAVLDDIFKRELKEGEVLEKRKVRRKTYNRWKRGGYFAAEYKMRMNAAKEESELILTLEAPAAAKKLVELMASDKQHETARKACLDIINFLHGDRKSKPKEKGEFEKVPQISPQLSGRIFEALALIRKQDKEKTAITKGDTCP